MNPNNKAKLAEEGAVALYKRLKSCDICPRSCQVDRTSGQTGFCQMNAQMVVYSAFLHQGEEPAISGDKGSGTVFFSGCTLKCVYCQNYEFSHKRNGTPISEPELAKVMLKLQTESAHNINLVTPTHFSPQILRSLAQAYSDGLSIPIVYNTSGYELKDIIEALDSIVDIYLTDLKYTQSQDAQKYSQAPDYPEVNQAAIKAMYEQVPTPEYSDDVLTKGLVIRHLVLPGHLKQTKEALDWIAQNTPKAMVSLMSQYQPYYKASEYPEISQPLTGSEYHQAVDHMRALELNGWIQGLDTDEGLAGPHIQGDLKI